MKKLLLFVFLLINQIAFSQIPKPAKNTYVNDYAGVLSKTQINGLNKSIFNIEKQYGVQLAIVLVNKIPAAYDIQDFAVLIGKKWHVGKNKKGIVYVAAINQRTQRIEVARNLDNIFTSAKCNEIMDYMKESFRGKDYNGGLVILIDQIASKLQTQNPIPQQAQTASAAANTPTRPAVKENAAANNDDNHDALIGFLFVAGVVIILMLYLRSRNKKQRTMQQLYNNQNSNNSDYYNPGLAGMDYSGQPQPDHTLRNVAAGAIGGAVAGYAARALQDRLSHHDNNQNNENLAAGQDDDEDNKSSNWGNWDDSGSDTDSSDSGFSDDSSSGSDSDSGATSNW